MNQIWIVVVVVAALLIFTRLRARRRPEREQRPPGATLRIQGYQVSAYVHPHMSQACLYDHGMQFGKGFRRKVGPALPHDAGCQCEVTPFSFTSSEVFNGALRSVSAIRSSIAGLPAAQAAQLIERLKAVEARPLPADAAAYIAAVEPQAFAAQMRAALEDFLRERHRFLRRRGASGPQGEPPRLPDNASGELAGPGAEPAKTT